MATKIFNATETDYTGTAGADLIIGNDLGNFIDAGEGNNVVYGGGGSDILLASSGDDLIAGGAGDDLIDAGSGNNILSGDDGNDFITSLDGDDLIDGGNGDDQIYAGDGNNIISGGAGNDYIGTGEGDDIITGGSGNDIIDAGEGDDILSGGEGIDLITGQGATAGDETVVGNLYLVSSDDTLLGGEGNDTFKIGAAFEGETVIVGGLSELDNSGNEARYVDKEIEEGGEGEEEEEEEEEAEIEVIDSETGLSTEIEDQEMAEQTVTDVQLNLVTRPGSSQISTYATTIAGYNAVDTLEFTQSGNFENIEFSGIERLELASGINITLSAEQLLENGASQSLVFLNPGTHIYGVAGGPAETVTVNLEFEETEFVPEEDIVGASPVDYDAASIEFDDYSVAELFHNVDIVYDASEGEAGSFARVDGANESAGASETLIGGDGVEYATMRLGDDTVYGNGGNDLLIGHGGADHLDGGEGDDIFVIGGFGSGVQGTTSKADDGNAEWIATGAKHDVIIGGDGTDTLRVTTGIGANSTSAGTVVLNDANFQNMEVVQVGGTVDRLNVEDTALQLLNDHYYFAANGTVADLSNTLGNNGGTIDNVVIDASGVTANGLLFEGNGNTQTFIGTTQADRFVGNGGNDVLTGNAGADTFVFGKVHEQVVTGDDDEVQTYVDTAFDLTGVDTITDFTSGTDQIELNTDQFASLAGFTSANLVIGSSAQDADDYLVFDSATNTLKYDADGNGAGAAIDIAVLTGVSSITAADIAVV